MAIGAVAVDLAVVVACAAGLWIGANLLVDGAVSLSGRVGLSGTVVGLTVVAIGTSAPELAVTIDAAIEGQGAIAVGNVVGSNVFNLGFLLGGLAAVKGVAATRELVVRDAPVLVATAALVTLFLWDGTLARWEGAVLAAGWGCYLAVLLWQRDRTVPPVASTSEADGASATDSAWRSALSLFVGLALVLGGAHLLVGAASDLARHAGIAEWLVGLTVVAAGTSMPEFATAAAAVGRGRPGVSAGTLVGSDIANLLLALGLAAVATPMTVGVSVGPSMLLLTGSVVLVAALLATGRRLTRPEGALLVGVALLRWVVPVLA